MSFFFSKLQERMVLLGINLQVTIRSLMEFVRVAVRYYPRLRFFKMDALLLCSYLRASPFRLSKHFLLERGAEDLYTYGETPLTTLEAIAHQCGLSAQDTVFELGCGRGRSCFWLNQFIGCSVVGVEYVPTFVEKAQHVQRRFQVKGVSFRLEDLFQTDLTGATVIYLYGTCFSAEELDPLIDRLSRLPEGTKVITVSYPLTECRPDAPFPIIHQFKASFTWGKADVYLQVKT